MMKPEKGGAFFMKCQHCGINFDDSERECPMCGARAGSKGRLGEARKSMRVRDEEPERAKRTGSARPKTQTGARRARASVKPIRENKKNGKGKVAVIAVAAVLLINFLPALIDLFDTVRYEFTDDVGESAYSEAQEDLYYVPGETYPYDPDNYQSVYAALYDLTGGYAAATLSDGSVLELDVQPGEMGDYTLIMQDGTGSYLESGYTWCAYNYPEEEMYNEAYPPEQYDCFTLCLTMDENAYEGAQGGIPERYALDEYGERWFFLYYAPETGAVVLEDMEGSDLFGADEFVFFEPLENG